MKTRVLGYCLLAIVAAGCGGSDGAKRKRDSGAAEAGNPAQDARRDSSGSTVDGGGLARDAAVDAPSRPDIAWLLPDAPFACRVDIAPVTPTSLVNLTAGPTAFLRIQGTVFWGQTPPFSPIWSWSVTRSDGQAVESKPVAGDPSQAQFPISLAGRYDITVNIGGGCVGSARALVEDPQNQSRVYHVRALPPPSVSAAVPYEVDVQIVAGTGPTTRNIELDTGTPVAIDPTNGPPLAVAVPSFIRIQSNGSTWVTTGRSSNQGPFRTVLDPLLEYQILVVPDPSADGRGSIPPFLLNRSTSGKVKVDADYVVAHANPLLLPKGISVTGHLIGPGGPTAAATIGLQSYQSAAAGQTDLVFSTVGQADSDGAYALVVNPVGNFSIVITPPPGSALPVPTVDQHINLTDTTTVVPALDFEWLSLPTTDLTLAVALPDGSVPQGSIAVHLESSAGMPAGVLTVGSAPDGGSDGWVSQTPGTVRRDSSTDRFGMATFPSLPRGTYDVRLVPPTSLSSWGITKASVNVKDSDALRMGVFLAPKVVVMGRLLDANDDAANDSAGTTVVATDLGHDTIAPVVTAPVFADGTYFLSLDPERTYSLAARPAAGRRMPSWVPLFGFSTGRVNMQLDDQRVSKGALVQGHVSYAGAPVAGAVVQAFCVGLLPDCEDRTNLAAGTPPAFASVVSDASGSYAFYLPDPATLR